MKTRIVILPVKLRVKFETERDYAYGLREMKKFIHGLADSCSGGHNYSVRVAGYKALYKTDRRSQLKAARRNWQVPQPL